MATLLFLEVSAAIISNRWTGWATRRLSAFLWRLFDFEIPGVFILGPRGIEKAI